MSINVLISHPHSNPRKKVLNTYADTFEVWSSLKKEEHKKINSIVHASFVEMASGCYRRREVRNALQSKITFGEF